MPKKNLAKAVATKKSKSVVVDGDKRQYAPYTLKWTCPECGGENVRDYSGDDYFSYPPFGKPFKEKVYCFAQGDDNPCEHEVEVEVRLEIVLTVLGSS